ncbi:D-tyrosyl-tRNA(Tyr) deacylase [Loa loa]|uniref:D-aminoacyl-tRNA deacylase n=1 Tax=Loa loa TaxID=7209 RepID=A0A1I7VRI1_LOALO|nr:D-tyrosyl-tRNA(Tyr) deacylase [Loa loa]EFO22135.1 D-tyrosyl-tRNA(Tyr) deacylase [Loa loa]
MRAVIQRVTKAAVSIDGQLESSIDRGICVLLAISVEDTSDDIQYMVRKLLGIRMFPNIETGKRWDKSVKDLGLEILCVSQFTLYGLLKGNKLDFHRSMAPTESHQVYQNFISELRKAYAPERIKDGRFGAMMNVQIENDGPVTFILDSKIKE